MATGNAVAAFAAGFIITHQETPGPMAGERRRTVLLAWECGDGFGHATQLSKVGAALMRRGVEVCAAVASRTFAMPLLKEGIRIIDAPRWPLPPDMDTRRPPATLTGGLLLGGLGESANVRAILEGWQRLLDAEKPDLVVCDYAPLAGLAAFGRVPVMQTGAAFYTPPAHIEAMPPVYEASPPYPGDAEVLAATNAALEALGRPPLEHIGALFRGDDCFVSSFPILDPYADLRDTDAEGPFLAARPEARQADARGVFAYLQARTLDRVDVVAALCALGGMLDAYLPLAPRDILARLAAAGVTVHDAPVPLAQVLPRRRLLLHNGSAGVASDAIAAGTPQFTFAVHIEHYVNGSSLAAAGLGRALSYYRPDHRLDARDIRAAMADDDMAQMAEAAARLHAPILDANPLELMTQRCLRLL